MPATRLAFCRRRTRFLLTTQEARRFCRFLRQIQSRQDWSVRQMAVAAKGTVGRQRMQDWLNSTDPVVSRNTAAAVVKVFGAEVAEVIQTNRDRVRLSGLDDVLSRAATYNLPSPDLMFRAIHELFLYLREWSVSVSMTAQTRSEGDEAFLRIPLGNSACQAQVSLVPTSHGFCYGVQIVKGASRTETMEGVLTLDSARRLRFHIRELDRRETRAENVRFQVDRRSTAFSNSAHRS